MATRIGGNTNTNDTAFMPDAIGVDAITSTILTTTTKQTITLILTNDGNQDAFIKFQAASVDNDKRGFILYKGTASTVILSPNIYVGEISAIARNGNTTIYVVNF